MKKSIWLKKRRVWRGVMLLREKNIERIPINFTSNFSTIRKKQVVLPSCWNFVYHEHILYFSLRVPPRIVLFFFITCLEKGEVWIRRLLLRKTNVERILINFAWNFSSEKTSCSTNILKFRVPRIHTGIWNYLFQSFFKSIAKNYSFSYFI